MSIQHGIPYFKYSFQYGGGDGELVEHDHSSMEEGGAVPLASISGHSKAIHDALAINADKVDGLDLPGAIASIITGHSKAIHDALGLDHAELSNVSTNQHHIPAAPGEHTHESPGEGGKLDKYSSVFDLKDTIDNILSDHTKAIHDAMAINADKVDGLDLPGVVTAILTNHSKALHDALAIDADKVDGVHLPAYVSQVLVDHHKQLHDALNIDAFHLQGETPAVIVTNARVKAHFPDYISALLLDHTKVVHDNLSINADTVDNMHIPNTIANILSNHSKAIHETLGLAAKNVPSCRVYKAYPDQVIPHSTETKAILDLKHFDNLNNWSTVNSEFTVPAGHAGRYLIIHTTVFEGVGSVGEDENLQNSIWKNDVLIATHERHVPSYPGYHGNYVTSILNLAVNDVIHFCVWHFSATEDPKNITADPITNSAFIQKLLD